MAASLTARSPASGAADTTRSSGTRPAATRGAQWTTIADASLLPPGTTARATVTTGLGSGSGLSWVLGGVWLASPVSAAEPSIWHSDDTRKWDRKKLPLPAGATSGQVQGMASLRTSAIAVGASWKDGDVDAAVWTSSNRTDWKLFGVDGQRQAGQQVLYDVAATDEGFIAIGNEIKDSKTVQLIVRGDRKGLHRLDEDDFPLAGLDLRNIQDVASDGVRRVVVVANVGTTTRSRVHAWFSDDAGRTFRNLNSDFPTATLDYTRNKPRLNDDQSSAAVAAIGWIKDPADSSQSEFYAIGQRSFISQDGNRTSELVAWSSANGKRFRLNGPGFLADIGSFAQFDDSAMQPYDFNPATGTQYGGLVSLFDTRSGWPMLAMIPVRSNGFVARPLTLPVEVVGESPGPMLWGRLNDDVTGVLTVGNGSGTVDVNFFDVESDVEELQFEPGELLVGFPKPSPKLGIEVATSTDKNRSYLGLAFPLRRRATTPQQRRVRRATPPVSQVYSWTPDRTGKLKPVQTLLSEGTAITASVRQGNSTMLFGRVVSATGDIDGAVWRMDDKGAITAIKTTGLDGEGAQVILDAAKTEDGWVAVGTTDGAEGPRDAAVWLSDNGTDWNRDANEVFAQAGDEIAAAVCTLRDGRLVIGGVTDRADETREQRPIVWYQDQNGDWDASPLARRVGAVTACASTPLGVMLGGTLNNGAGVWKTLNGSAYTEFELPDHPAGFVQITAVAAGSSGVVLAAQVDDGALTQDVAVWVQSSKREPIRRLQLPPSFGGWGSQFVADITLEGSRAVLVGSSDAAPRVWETTNVFRR